MRAVRSRLGWWRSRPALSVGVVILVWVAAGFTTPGFDSWPHLRYMLELASVVGLVGAGQTLVVIAGGIDLSVGAIMTLTTIALPIFTWSADPTGLIAVIGVLALATGIGVLNGIGIAWLRVHPMIMTLAMATFLQGILILLAGGSAVSLDNPIVQWLGTARPFGFSACIVLWIVVALLVLFLLHRTPLGARFFALGSNPVAARLSGVNTAATMLCAYGLSGLMCALAGLLALGMNGQGYIGIGDPYLLTSIAAVVLGGTTILGGHGTYAGTVPGAVLLVTITALITDVNASPGLRDVLFGTLVLGLLLVSGREAVRR
jgi:ribose transport system permease protein